ncbi:tRNA-specific 2-thiouridylase mnmA [Candidatus Moduliflexus flocculans]|uniref:tRNA-specific 2-thiouridylase mnmA n=1 Tax=Candidatus Moduliflexus flocculans TaxID=1499966 RepID=A0A0S6VRK2_9BACT|nr:tRNA-specific 2-thiouridylase mnmA [Candidatus Moduliflexus flocculans]
MVTQLNWIAIDALIEPMRVNAKLRSAHVAAAVQIEPLTTDTILVKFEAPQEAITPGQSAVFYDGDLVVGGGIIANNTFT